MGIHSSILASNKDPEPSYYLKSSSNQSKGLNESMKLPDDYARDRGRAPPKFSNLVPPKHPKSRHPARTLKKAEAPKAAQLSNTSGHNSLSEIKALS